MPGTIRWIICPVVDWIVTDAENGTQNLGRYPLVGTLTDPGTGQTYPFSQTFPPTNTRTLCFVRGVTWTPVDQNNQCINVLQRDYTDAANILATTPLADGWTNQRFNQFTTRAQQAGFTTTGLTRSSTFLTILNNLGRQIDPNFDASGTWVI